MEWEKSADIAIRKVPFFVRKKVRARVEKEARGAGKIRVSLDDVKTTQKRFLNKMDEEVTGYRLDACFGGNGCPNRISDTGIQEKINALLKKEDLLGFLRTQVSGSLKFHHEFTVTLADCPNACSQPQIRDIGIIGAKIPCLTDDECIECAECVHICREAAVSFEEGKNRPTINRQFCVNCGQCIDVCPTRTIDTEKAGYRVLIGGKLGRHPRLADELPGIYDENQVLDILRRCVSYYKTHSKNGRRFAELIARDSSFVPELIRQINRM